MAKRRGKAAGKKATRKKAAPRAKKIDEAEEVTSPTNAAKAKRLNFAQLIWAGRSQKDAAQEAGYGGTERSLTEQASVLIRHSDVQAELERLRNEAGAQAIVTREELLEFHSSTLRVDLAKYALVNDEGEFQGLNLNAMLADGVSHLLNSIELTTGKIQKIAFKLESKLGSAKELARLQGFHVAKQVDLRHSHGPDPATMTNEELATEWAELQAAAVEQAKAELKADQAAKRGGRRNK